VTIALLSSAALLSACQQISFDDRLTACRSEVFTLVGDFEGARLGGCQFHSERSVQLINAPENKPINHSPWYAFKVKAGRGPLTVRIDYTLHTHRYWPKISTNGVDWAPVSSKAFRQDGDSLVMQLDVQKLPLWVSAQEQLTSSWYAGWLSELESSYGTSRSVVGQSIEGRPLFLIESNPAANKAIVLLGRQHPPEVTGALAMRFFVDELSRCEGLARCDFFKQFNLIIAPQLNPDGVANGHWRHNMAGTDLNRDWGPFEQPETRLMNRAILDVLDRGSTPIIMIDFHSTQRNLFYTQSENEEKVIGTLVSRWLAAARSRPGIYEFSQERRHNEGRPTAKNYFFQRFSIPAVTYEVGDETPRADIETSARILARTLIHELLESHHE